MDILFDFDVPLIDRMTTLMSNPELVNDTIAKMQFIYTMTSSHDTAQYLLAIANEPSFDISCRVSAATTVATHKEKWANFTNEGYTSLVRIFRELPLSTPFVVRQSILYSIIPSGKHVFQARAFLLSLVTLENIPEKSRFECITGIERQNISQKKIKYLVSVGMLRIVETWSIGSMYWLVASQTILSYNKHVDKIGFLLADVALTAENENTRADAADILLRCGDDALKEVGQSVIDQLGKGVYTENAQNVHVRSIERSCEENIDRLMLCTPNLKSFEESISEFLEKYNSHSLASKVSSALDRVAADRAMYSNHQLSLSSIFRRVWAFISSSEHRSEMIERLIEELADAEGLCSSGFMARMVNALSGFSGFGVGIDFNDQIAAHFAARLNEAIKSDEECDLILEEMASTSSGPLVRKILLKNFSKIREEMYTEFKDHVSESDFDLYLSRAYAKYIQSWKASPKTKILHTYYFASATLRK
jgi:hypothetical protein